MATTKEESRILFERMLDDKTSFLKNRLVKAHAMVTMWRDATLRALESFQKGLDQVPQVSDDEMSIEPRLITMDIHQLQRKVVVFDKVLKKMQRYLDDPQPQSMVTGLKERCHNVQNQADVDKLLLKTQTYLATYAKRTYKTSNSLANDYIQLFREMLDMFEKDFPLGMSDEDHAMEADNYIQDNMDIFQGLLHGAEQAEDHTSRRGVHRHKAFTPASNADRSQILDELSKHANNTGSSHINRDAFTRASNTVQSCSMHEQYEKACPQSVSFPQYTPDGRTQLGPVGQTPNGLSHKQITGIVDLFCVETRPGEAQARESRIMDTMDQWHEEDDALRRRGFSLMIPTPKPIPRRSPWIPDEELQDRRFNKSSKIGVEERADGGYPERYAKRNSTSSSDQDDKDNGDKTHKMSKKSNKKKSDAQGKADVSSESAEAEEMSKIKKWKGKKNKKVKDQLQEKNEQDSDSGSAYIQMSHQEDSSDDIERKKKKKKSAVKLMKGFINSPVISAKSVMNKMTTALEHHKDKSSQFKDHESDGMSDRYTSTKDASDESSGADERGKTKKQKSKKKIVKDQPKREELDYGSGSGNLHTFHMAYPEDFSDDIEEEKKKKKSATKLVKGFLNHPVSSAKSAVDKVTTVIEHHKSRQYKDYDSDFDPYASSTKDSLYAGDLDESDGEYGELDIGQDHYVNVSNISDVMVLAIRDRPARNKIEMSLRKGMVIKQKQGQNDQKMSFGWKRAKHGQKKYGYYRADDVVLYPSKENYDKMDLPLNSKTQNGKC